MTNNKNGLLIVISGPAGSGKGTVNSLLLKNDNFVYSVSATTRAPRPGEIDGINYHFVSVGDFKSMIDAGEMLEYTEYCGNYYGTIKSAAEKTLADGKNLILEIEVDGAMQVKKKYPQAVLIMLLPPSFSVQEKRLRERGTETEEKILERLRQTREEISQLKIYDYIVYNRDGKSEDAVSDIMCIVRAEKLLRTRNPDAGEDYFK